MNLNATNTNFETLTAIADASIAALDNSPRPDARRWQSAIRKAVEELQENPFWNFANGEFVMMSSTSGTTYTPNGKCSCIAYTAHHQPCRHLASKRLLERLAETM